MTAFELAVFVCIYRNDAPLLHDDVRKEVSLWFERMVAPADLKACVDHMLARGWLLQSGERLRPSNEGRALARPLPNGLIRMLDQGTRLLDVALMLSVLRLTHDQLGQPAEEDRA
jgi:hypothetical protein